MVTMQIQPTGVISGVCLIMYDATDFIPWDDSPDQPAGARTAVDSPLMRFDRLCESLGSTLRGVVVALFLPDKDRADAQQDTPKTVRMLREQMQNMARRLCLVFRMSRQSREQLREDKMYDSVLEHVFVRDSQYWSDIKVDDGGSSEP